MTRKLLVIPKGMQKELILNAHIVGHFGVKKVVELLDRDYSISNVREKVERLIQNCVPCILINRKQGKQEGFINTIDKGDLPVHTWHIDFLGPLTNTPRGYKHILVIIDAFTKFCWLFPTRNTTSKEVVDKMNILQATFGNPTRLISDHGADHRRVAATDYRIGDLVAIKRTQFLPLSKIKSKYLGPYHITGKCGQNRYAVWKVGSGEGPEKISTGTDYIKNGKTA